MNVSLRESMMKYSGHFFPCVLHPPLFYVLFVLKHTNRITTLYFHPCISIFRFLRFLFRVHTNPQYYFGKLTLLLLSLSKWSLITKEEFITVPIYMFLLVYFFSIYLSNLFTLVLGDDLRHESAYQNIPSALLHF